jgi:hypothetical protein
MRRLGESESSLDGTALRAHVTPVRGLAVTPGWGRLPMQPAVVTYVVSIT